MNELEFGVLLCSFGFGFLLTYFTIQSIRNFVVSRRKEEKKEHDRQEG